MNQIVIVPAVPSDIIYIFEINSLTWFDTYKSEKYWITENTLNNIPENLEKRNIAIERRKKEILDNPWSYFLAKDWEKVVWYASWKKWTDFNELIAIYILPEYQKQWIWNKLVTEVFKYLWIKKDIIVEVVDYNEKAIKFYESLWFIFEKQLEKFEIINWIWVWEIRMIKKF